jgi:hypothetical protein
MKPIYKKNYLAICVIMIITSLVLNSCTRQLDEISQTAITDDIFWKDTSHLIMATNYLYSSVPDASTLSTDNLSDLATNIRLFNTTSDGSRTAPATDAQWDDAYTIIRAVHNLMEKSVNIPNDAMKNYCIAQARFFRALAYFRLVRAYGDVPYINKTIKGRDDAALYTPRTDRRIVIDSIYADLDFAAAVCPQADQLPGTSETAGQFGREYGRITRSAALALKSRVALNEGSWHKFHDAPELIGPRDANRHFKIAKDAAQIIMTENKHSLYTGSGELSYQNLFRYPGETYTKNKENILARLYGKSVAENIAGQNLCRVAADGNCAATRAYVSLALYSDGLPVGKSLLDSTNKETGLQTDYRNRDPRLVQNLFRPGDPFGSVAAANPIYGNTFFYNQQKYFTGQADFLLAMDVFLDYIAIRYGEVLLNYAEATYELNGNISDSDLDLSINLIRKRATNNDNSKLPLLTNNFVNANGLDMREEIRRERSIELAFEGFRYWDIIRWKTAEIELPKPLLGRKYFDNVDYGGSLKPSTINGYIIYQAADKRRFDKNKDYLSPIPTTQIGLSNNTLKQNPNWN